MNELNTKQQYRQATPTQCYS